MGTGTDRENERKKGTKEGPKEPLFCSGKTPLFTASYKEVLKKIETRPAPSIMSPA
jgi:hypothetical protein